MRRSILFVIVLFALVVAPWGTGLAQDTSPSDGTNDDKEAEPEPTKESTTNRTSGGDANDTSPSQPGDADGDAKDRDQASATGNRTSPPPRRSTEPSRVDHERTDAERKDRARAAAAEHCRTHPDDARCERLRQHQASQAERARSERDRAEWDQQQREEHSKRDQAAKRLDDRRADQVGRLSVQDGSIEGRFIAFAVEPELGLIADLNVRGVPVFDAIALPVDNATQVRAMRPGSAQAATFQVHGAAWAFRITDAPAAPMMLEATQDAPIRFTLHPDIVLRDDRHGFDLLVPGKPGVAHFDGDVVRVDNETLEVQGTARFFVRADNPSLAVANKARPAIERALEARTFGAEVNVLKAVRAAATADDDPLTDAVADTVLYEDMELELSSGAVTDAVGDLPSEGVYTITVDAEAHEGKTIAVNFEAGLIDATNLQFRYFNVDENETVETTIRQASSLTDVLDPNDDGTVAEYWVVSDADGVQVLVSIPHFSVHKIELASVGAFIEQHPSLVIGTLGAAVIVALAVVGMARKPRDDL